MKIFIDFDDTIFAKTILRNEIDKKLQEVFGLSRLDIQRSYENFSGPTGERKMAYALDEHSQIIAEMISGNGGVIRDFFDKEYSRDLSTYVYDDVISTLEKLNMHTLIMLSFGDQNFQMMKIKNSGIEKYFDDIIVTKENKYSVMKEKKSDNDVVILVDDKEEYFSSMKKDSQKNITIHKLKPGHMCTSTFCDHHIRQFSEVCDVIST